MIYDVVILGGGVAGLTAAMYSSRGGAKTLLLEDSFVGGITATLQGVENFPGIPSMNGMDFVTNLYSQALNFGAQIELAKVNKIDFDNNTIISSIGDFEYKALIIATGSTYKKLNVPGEMKFNQRGVSYCAVCDGSLYKNKKIVVVTNGYSGDSSIKYLSNITKDIVVLDLTDKYKNTELQVYNNIIIKDIVGEDNVTAINIIENNIEQKLHCDGVFISIGREYNTDLFDGYIDINNGFIVTNNHLQTNINNVYAIGDIRENSIKQIICACSDGATASLNILKNIKK